MTKLSSKGQIIVPIELRKGLEMGTQFAVKRDNDVIILKKLDPDWEKIEKDFEEARKRVAKSGLKEEDVLGIVKRIREQIRREEQGS